MLERLQIAVCLVISATALGCPQLLPGGDINEAGISGRDDDAEANTGSDARTEDDATAEDDATSEDARTGDDARTGEDARTGDDATTEDDAAIEDATIDEDAATEEDAGPMCSPLQGQPCSLANLCGSTYDCSGQCTGGSTEPVCPCGPAMCAGNTWICTGACCDPLNGQPCDRAGYCGAVYDCMGACVGGSPPPSCPCGPASCDVANGQWSACPGATNFGASCSTADRCGGAIDCSGNCSGGALRPPCNCNAPMCLATGQWTACSDPSNLGADCAGGGRCGGAIACDGSCQGGSLPPPCSCATLTCLGMGVWSSCPDPMNLGASCDTPTRCGGAIDCNSNCAGGSPLPSCQCGTPTCSGCSGGSCGASSTCAGGTCQCTVNDCSCGGALDTSCSICGASGDLGTCSVDAYGCGAFATTTGCTFGCDPMTLTCNCSPDTGAYCVAGICPCACGDFERSGVVTCDGSCDPDFTCFSICRSECGPLGPSTR